MGWYKDHPAWQQVIGKETKAWCHFEDKLASDPTIAEQRRKAQSRNAKSDPCLVLHPQPVGVKTPPHGRRPKGIGQGSSADPSLDNRLQRLETHIARMHHIRMTTGKELLEEVPSRVGSPAGSTASQGAKAAQMPKTLAAAGSSAMLSRPATVQSRTKSQTSRGPGLPSTYQLMCSDLTAKKGDSMGKTWLQLPHKRAPQPFGSYLPHPHNVPHLAPRSGAVGILDEDISNPANPVYT